MPDVSAPNLLTTSPTGEVSADFSGHVHAGGLDLDEGGSPSPPDENRIRWINTGNGYAAEQMWGTIATDSSGFPNRYLYIESRDDALQSKAGVTLIARRAGTTDTGVYVRADPPGSVAANQPTRLIDENNNSDWVQCVGQPFGAKKRILEGGPFFNGPFSPGPQTSFNVGTFTLGVPWTTDLAVIGNFHDGSLPYICCWAWFVLSATQIQVVGYNTHPAAGATNIYWSGFILHN